MLVRKFVRDTFVALTLVRMEENPLGAAGSLILGTIEVDEETKEVRPSLPYRRILLQRSLGVSCVLAG